MDDDVPVLLAAIAALALAGAALGPNSYPAGSAVAASATESGAWFDYTYANPASGAVETKHSWVIIHDGLIFGSGWHEPGPSKSDAPSYTRAFVQQATNLYDALGLEETLAYYNRPESIDGQWYVFIATPDGEILGHYNAEDFAAHLQEMLDEGSFKATEEGVWVNHEDVNPATGEIEDKHFWLVEHDGLVFGSGWHHDESGN